MDDQVDEEELAQVFRINSSKKNSTTGDLFYISYEPSGKAVEEGLRLNKTGSANFLKEVSKAAFDLLPRQSLAQVSTGSKMVWDKKHKKYVKVFANHTKPEAGSSFLTKRDTSSGKGNTAKRKQIGDLYQDWKKKFKRDLPKAGEVELSTQQMKDLENDKKVDYRHKRKFPKKEGERPSGGSFRGERGSLNGKMSPRSIKGEIKPTGSINRQAFGERIQKRGGSKKPRNELKSQDQILKARRVKAREADRVASSHGRKGKSKGNFKR